MPSDRESADMAAIKAREAAVMAAIQRGDREIECGSFGVSQLRLLPVMADRWGRLWMVDGTRLVKWWGGGEALPADYDMSGDAVARNGDG